MTRIQVWVHDEITNKEFYLIFNKGSKLFNRVCNIQLKGGFTKTVKWNEDWHNRVQEIDDTEYRESYRSISCENYRY